ncbi:MAG TPA: sulfite exporter TauE/SafE family protein [Candidatus Limnocylindrales bacterium]|nr:sulfite exporter TauE/SafE family protein [Candidatus Limnocylindrales bacterium]
MLETLDLLVVALAAVAAGAVNALAGGGTLITFPMLVAVGVPAVTANVTNTVALCPGYFGATLAQRRELAGQRRRLAMLLPAAALGGVAGAMLLLQTGEKTFRELIPFLILLASVLLAVQARVRRWLQRRREDARAAAAGSGGAAYGEGGADGASYGGSFGAASEGGHALEARAPDRVAAVLTALAAIYGGYFGAGLSVIVLAVLGVALEDSLTRLNALKQAVALATNVAAAVFFLFSGQVVWSAALAMAAGALAGGALGGRLASLIAPEVLRWIVVAVGVFLSLVYFAR